eukprot:14454283-Alexandrium_andersonii.AAC.1
MRGARTRCVLIPQGWAWALACPGELGNCVSELAASCVLVVQVGLRVRGELRAIVAYSDLRVACVLHSQRIAS